MNTIRDIFRIGNGPSSSHTMGPVNAAKYVLKKYQNIRHLEIVLQGSLAATGRGHFTDLVLDSLLKDISHKIVFDIQSEINYPNTLVLKATLLDGTIIEETVYSIGGGSIITPNGNRLDDTTIKDVYPHANLTEILDFCKENNLTLVEYIKKYEGEDIINFSKQIYDKMNEVVSRGLSKEGLLPGTLKVSRRAKQMYEKFTEKDHQIMISVIGAYAASEENASGGEIVTAPTCGSSGVIPGIIQYLKKRNYSEESILNGLLVAGLIGQICKTNGSIAGAEAGCQAEIGVACSMGAALIATAKGWANNKIEQCAEIALEHSLGLTCDPVGGYVIVPCIERNAMYALKARDAVSIASLVDSQSTLVSFDTSVKTMVATGKDLQAGYRETSTKGLANYIK